MKRITIEALVRWAAVDEWPKAKPDDWSAPGRIGSGWGSVLSYVQLLTVIDDNHHGVVPDVRLDEAPAADATAVADALAAIEGSSIGEIEPEWLIGDWATSEDLVAPLVKRAMEAIEEETVVDRDGGRRARRGIGALVVGLAILGAPDCILGRAPKLVVKKHTTGADMWVRRVRRAREIDADGNVTAWDFVEVPVVRCKGRRSIDAYRAMTVWPAADVADCLRRRVRHVVWRAALRSLADMLTGKLIDHEIADDGASGMPWLGLGRPAGRILTAAGGRSRSRLVEKKKRRNA